ncbi:suppressor of lurcher protein 1, partial [Clonorchis sinensis]
CTTHSGDKLDIFIGVVSLSNRWRSLCGTNLPVNLRTMNMRVPVLTIQFKSDNQTTAMENGFYLNYRIVSSHEESSESSSKYEPLSDEWKQKEYTLPVEKEANQSLKDMNSTRTAFTYWVMQEEIINGGVVFISESHKETTKSTRCINTKNSGALQLKTTQEDRGEIKRDCSEDTRIQIIPVGTINIPRQLGNAIIAKSSASLIGDEEICRWIFLGRTNQRIRINLRPWSKDPMNSAMMEDGVAHKRTADRPYFRYGQTKLDKTKKPSHKGPMIRSIGCNSPYHLEIRTFQNLSTSLPQFKERGHGSREWKLKDYKDDSVANLVFKDSNWIVGDRIKLCFQRYSNEELRNKAFMSSQLPRIDVVLKASFDEWLNDRHLSLQLPEESEFFSVDYKFITGCRFTFESKISKSGNFSSPNYPGLYPVDTVCEYRLMGEKNEVISLRFLEFDIESSSSTCSADEMGDYVELNPCSMLDFLNMPQVRYCQARPKHKEVPIRWNNPCLKIRFVSNEVIVRRGFLAHYSFEISGLAACATNATVLDTSDFCEILKNIGGQHQSSKEYLLNRHERYAFANKNRD